MRQAAGRSATGAAVGTGISLGANVFRLLLDLGPARPGRPFSARAMVRLALLAIPRRHRPPVTGLEIERFPACLRIGLKIGLRIGLGLFCLGLGIGVCLGLCLWLLGRLLVGIVVAARRLLASVLHLRASHTGPVARQRRGIERRTHDGGRQAGGAGVRRRHAARQTCARPTTVPRKSLGSNRFGGEARPRRRVAYH
ncbi:MULTISPECIES: hypothetical protein [unclassified Mycobacterium]|uniref:hypothetical protein n=1 Tax=unclassified Mycobacterium TaxID=2642494 RepID=UPI00114D413D|nr:MULTISPECIES: hypothetical protein [unclassified Mycobacterium]